MELLVSISLVALLAGLLLPVLQGARDRGKMVKEMQAGRQLITAYASYAAANDGSFMLGYDKNTQQIQLATGTSLAGEMCCRYPWRLAPYLADQVEEIFLVYDNKKYTNGAARDSFDYEYRASLNPALGVNAYCVGGYDDGTSSGYFSTDVVKRMGGAVKPANLIVFVSARMKISGTQNDEVAGNFIVTPPYLFRSRWSPTYDPDGQSSSFGNVALRWSSQAVCVFLDGHVALLKEAELRDMRHWSNTAADTDNASYVVPR